MNNDDRFTCRIFHAPIGDGIPYELTDGYMTTERRYEYVNDNYVRSTSNEDLEKIIKTTLDTNKTCSVAVSPRLNSRIGPCVGNVIPFELSDGYLTTERIYDYVTDSDVRSTSDEQTEKIVKTTLNDDESCTLVDNVLTINANHEITDNDVDYITYMLKLLYMHVVSYETDGNKLTITFKRIA